MEQNAYYQEFHKELLIMEEYVPKARHTPRLKKSTPSDPMAFEESFIILGASGRLARWLYFNPPKLPPKVGKGEYCEETDIFAHYIRRLIGQLRGEYYQDPHLDSVSRSALSLEEKRKFILAYLRAVVDAV